MAKRPSVKEILEAARKGGPAKPADESAAPIEPETAAAPEVANDSVEESVAAAPAARSVPASVPTPSSLGRPLTLKEKLAAARAGGAPQPGAAPVAKASAPSAAEASDEVPAGAEVESPKAVPAPAKPLGRPLTLAEKLAAARGAGAAAPAGAAPAKPAAAKAGAAPAAKAAARVLPPLEEITDPRDLAEALRQTAAKTAKEQAAKAAAAAPAKSAAKPAAAKPTSAPPKPSRPAAAAGPAIDRRGFIAFGTFVSWIAVAWVSFTAAVASLTAMCGRFMFPNVLAEPPSTIKVGLPSNFTANDVSERFKAEWGFWIVRSSVYSGEDIIYALQSVCTHLGCPPNWLAAEQKFKCPCHGSGFYISGINFEGPAPRPLERFKVTLADDGQILVDKSQKYQQELGQWSDPESFISA
jgi:cytochrome b6-f complex iron-sulfur subunit